MYQAKFVYNEAQQLCIKTKAKILKDLFLKIANNCNL